LKSGQVDATVVRNQLQGGADVIDYLVEDLRPIDFFPIVASNRMRNIERRALSRFRIRFRGTPYRPIVAGCGSQLAQLVEKYS
jgi:hypothetical protein